MSYDISLLDPVSRKVIEIKEPHFMQGGTYQLGGTKELWLNITYNYSRIYRREDLKGANYTMQKSNNMTKCVFIAVPADLLEEVGIDDPSDVQMWASDGRLIVEPVDEAEEDLLQIGYTSLEDFLESLSPRNQYDALCFLSMLQAEREGRAFSEDCE